MLKKVRFRKFLTLLYRSEKGFTLIELLVVIAVLGGLSGIAFMNLGGFIGSGQERAKDTEGHQVQVAALCYVADGNSISEPFTVGPEDQGVLDSYLVGNLKYSWTVDVDDSVSQFQNGGEPNPEPASASESASKTKTKTKTEPEPKPKSEPKTKSKPA
jgi:prepilin-type N-terminal cleavage/methylation domain-containing protein